MSSDDLASILELGWQSSREAWQLLAPNDDGEFTTAGASETGCAMDLLAYELRRVGHIKPARLAFSAAFVLNSLASGTIEFEPVIAEKTSQLVTVLAEMLLELEAAREISTKEPKEIVEELKSNWGLELEVEVLEDDELEAVDELVECEQVESPESVLEDHELIAISDELATASGSLLDRVLREGDFPHTATLGRIHHLATLMRDHVIKVPTIRPVTEFTGFSEELRSPATSLSIPPIEVAPFPTTIESPGPTQLEINHQQPGVLILDRSPFIRMLLTSAIESAGYAAMATADWAGALNDEHQRPWNVMICGISELTEEDCELLASRAMAWNASVISFDGKPIVAEQHQMQRTDLEGMLKLIKTKLGPISRPMLLSA